MGSYTDPQNFYLINSDELVNVDQDLNYNLQRADDRVRPLVEYVVTDEPSISASSLPKDTGFKWWKTYTGAIFNYLDGSVRQDVNCSVDEWSVTGLTFETGYGSVDQDVNRIAYSVTVDGFVRFRGRLHLTSGGELPANTTVNFLTLPSSILPVRQKYFTIYGGNAAASDFQCFRIFVPQQGSGDDRMEYIKYGGNSASASDRYFSLNDVFYSINDTP
jgi:hypothetical protein